MRADKGTHWHIGVIGGSGLAAGIDLDDAQEIRVASPFGEPSGPVITGWLGGVRMTFLARHGAGHAIPPSTVNYRANVDVLKRCGVTDLVALSAIGSLREEMAPGQFVVVDQFIDRTAGRPGSFFGAGLVAHVSLADPVCPRLSALLADAAGASGAGVHRGGTYVAIEGPQFSTRAESHMYRAWGADVIGMTAMPEARLAREAELPYALVGMVTDYDCWRPEEAGVEVSHVLEVMHHNAGLARQTVRALAAGLPGNPRRQPDRLRARTRPHHRPRRARPGPDRPARTRWPAACSASATEFLPEKTPTLRTLRGPTPLRLASPSAQQVSLPHPASGRGKASMRSRLREGREACQRAG